MDSALTAAALAVPALTCRPVEARADTFALCQRVREAEARHFPAWCAVIDDARAQRPRGLPSDVVELERERLADLHAAVQRLREHCTLDVDRAERECHALMRAQVERDLVQTAALRVARGAPVREVIRAQASQDRVAAYETRAALCCGRGWPHRGEPVRVTAWINDNTQPEGRFVYEGEAIYTGSYDIHNTSHTVLVAGLEVNRGELHLAWEPHERWGNADPCGDIAMRVLSRPDHPLPCPLPRWPAEDDVTGIDEHAGVAVGEQIALL